VKRGHGGRRRARSGSILEVMTMNTKKDFEATARIIADEVDFILVPKTSVRYLTIRRIADAFADLYARDNPLFNRALFFKACGMEASV
jgi:hypothetical protein